MESEDIPQTNIGELPEEENQKNRKGATKISSVSISKEFRELIFKYNLSPTEIFRRGVAVTLHDLGQEGYVTEVNTERSEFADKFLKDFDRFHLIQTLKEIEKKTKEIKKFLGEIDSYTENGGSA
jgi:hypothetical protein